MYKLFAENKRGEKTELTNNPALTIVSIDGFDPPEATINTTKIAGADGSVFNSAYANERPITITGVINYPAEQNRLMLYKWFKSKAPIRLYYQTESRDLYIDGYTQSIQIGYFEKKETLQIVVICPDPWLRNTETETEVISSIVPQFEFPMDIPAEGIEFSYYNLNDEITIVNYGDVDTGAVITIHATGAVNTPKIYNSESLEYMIINTTMVAGDDIIINTNRGEKSINRIRDGVRTVLIGDLADGSIWLQFAPGINKYVIDANSGAENMSINLMLIDLYEGV